MHDIMKSIVLACTTGDLMNDNKKDKIAFKKRMLEASGCTFPDDWDKLPLEEQERRINKALEVNVNNYQLYPEVNNKTSNPKKRSNK